MTAQAHADAVKALVGGAVRLYELDEVPDSPVLPYGVLYIGAGDAARLRLVPVSDWRDSEFQVTAVGYDLDGARSVAEKVRTAVLDKRPTVPGRSTGKVRQEATQLPQIDRDVIPHLHTLAVVYAFSSTPT